MRFAAPSAQRHPRPPSGGVVLGRLTERPRVEGALLVVDDLQPPTPTEGVNRGVDRDPLEPGRERLRLVESAKSGERLHERLLPGVVGETTIGSNRVRHARQAQHPVAIEERARGSLDPRGRARPARCRGGDVLPCSTSRSERSYPSPPTSRRDELREALVEAVDELGHGLELVRDDPDPVLPSAPPRRRVTRRSGR